MTPTEELEWLIADLRDWINGGDARGEEWFTLHRTQLLRLLRVLDEQKGERS
jgi:hypothetical protein